MDNKVKKKSTAYGICTWTLTVKHVFSTVILTGFWWIIAG